MFLHTPTQISTTTATILPPPLHRRHIPPASATHRRRQTTRTNCSKDSNSRNWYNPENNYSTNSKEERFEFSGFDDEEFGFGREKDKRVWWVDDDGGGFDDEDGYDDGGFGVLGGVGFSWISKVLRAFGWMVPAVFISMLMGTGPNTLIMALAVPLAQSALSLVFDALRGSPKYNSRPKPRAKRRPSARTTNYARTSEERRRKASNEASAGNGEKKKPNFGGWDELDERLRAAKKTEKANEQNQMMEGKLSRRVRNKDKPLVVRLFIAVFPFLGSWFKLL